MINLYKVSDTFFVWSHEDWKTLRYEYRIVGSFFGMIPRSPFQGTASGLPFELLPEEVSLLVSKGICKLVKNVQSEPSVQKCAKMQEYYEKNKMEQEKFLKSDRKRKIAENIDQILAGKKRKLSSIKVENKIEVKSEYPLTAEGVLREEYEKIDSTPLLHHLHYQFTDPLKEKKDIVEVDWSYPTTKFEKSRCRIFADLWEKGYYISSGGKFGGDFLVYPGDPVRFHAHFIVKCKHSTEETKWLELASLLRIATSCRKTLVIASYQDEDDSISYSSFQFTSFSIYNE